jgi:hypothetical protein
MNQLDLIIIEKVGVEFTRKVESTLEKGGQHHDLVGVGVGMSSSFVCRH